MSGERPDWLGTTGNLLSGPGKPEMEPSAARVTLDLAQDGVVLWQHRSDVAVAEQPRTRMAEQAEYLEYLQVRVTAIGRER